MAFFRASIGGGGGSETETTLWTNPSPSSAFGQQEVSLSSAYTNFKRLRFYYKAISSSAETSVEYQKSVISSWIQYGATVSNGDTEGMLGGNYNAWYARQVRRGSTDSKVFFSTGTRLNASGTNGSVCIPTKITGIN